MQRKKENNKIEIIKKSTRQTVKDRNTREYNTKLCKIHTVSSHTNTNQRQSMISVTITTRTLKQVNNLKKK